MTQVTERRDSLLEFSSKSSFVCRFKKFRSRFSSGGGGGFSAAEKEERMMANPEAATELTVESSESNKDSEALIPRQRRSGLSALSTMPLRSTNLVSGIISEENEEGLDEDVENNNSAIPTVSTVAHSVPTLERKTSEPSFEKFLQRFRRSSDALVTYQGQGLGRPEEDEDEDGACSRKMSVDSAGILKKGRRRKMRKSVSFSEQEQIYIIDALEDEDLRGAVAEAESASESSDTVVGFNKVLIPTFVFPVRKPTFETDFRQRVLLLEGLTVLEDLHVLGNARINLTLLKALQTEEQKLRGQKISVWAVYSMDNWTTRGESLAFLVQGKSHPALAQVESACFRFLIDCSGLEIGEQMQFALCCVDKNSQVENNLAGSRSVKYEDDNGKQFYRVSCAPALNPWAMRAAQELNNFAPVVKFNRNYID